MAISTVFPLSEDDSQKNRRIEGLSGDACALAWDSDGGKTARCVERVMAAMNDDQGFRNTNSRGVWTWWRETFGFVRKSISEIAADHRCGCRHDWL